MNKKILFITFLICLIVSVIIVIYLLIKYNIIKSDSSCKANTSCNTIYNLDISGYPIQNAICRNYVNCGHTNPSLDLSDLQIELIQNDLNALIDASSGCTIFEFTSITGENVELLICCRGEIATCVALNVSMWYLNFIVHPGGSINFNSEYCRYLPTCLQANDTAPTVIFPVQSFGQGITDRKTSSLINIFDANTANLNTVEMDIFGTLGCMPLSNEQACTYLLSLPARNYFTYFSFTPYLVLSGRFPLKFPSNYVYASLTDPFNLLMLEQMGDPTSEMYLNEPNLDAWLNGTVSYLNLALIMTHNKTLATNIYRQFKDENHGTYPGPVICIPLPAGSNYGTSFDPLDRPMYKQNGTNNYINQFSPLYDPKKDIVNLTGKFTGDPLRMDLFNKWVLGINTQTHFLVSGIEMPSTAYDYVPFTLEDQNGRFSPSTVTNDQCMSDNTTNCPNGGNIWNCNVTVSPHVCYTDCNDTDIPNHCYSEAHCDTNKCVTDYLPPQTPIPLNPDASKAVWSNTKGNQFTKSSYKKQKPLNTLESAKLQIQLLEAQALKIDVDMADMGFNSFTVIPLYDASISPYNSYNTWSESKGLPSSTWSQSGIDLLQYNVILNGDSRDNFITSSHQFCIGADDIVVILAFNYHNLIPDILYNDINLYDQDYKTAHATFRGDEIKGPNDMSSSGDIYSIACSRTDWSCKGNLPSSINKFRFITTGAHLSLTNVISSTNTSLNAKTISYKSLEASPITSFYATSRVYPHRSTGISPKLTNTQAKFIVKVYKNCSKNKIFPKVCNYVEVDNNSFISSGCVTNIDDKKCINDLTIESLNDGILRDKETESYCDQYRLNKNQEKIFFQSFISIVSTIICFVVISFFIFKNNKIEISIVLFFLIALLIFLFIQNKSRIKMTAFDIKESIEQKK